MTEDEPFFTESLKVTMRNRSPHIYYVVGFERGSSSCTIGEPMDPEIISQIITLVILILSIVLHEVAHGYAANWLGDPTARLAGRLSPNPLRHIDPLGSVIIPAILFITGANFLFGFRASIFKTLLDIAVAIFFRIKLWSIGR